MKYKRKVLQEVDAIQFVGTNYIDIEKFLDEICGHAIECRMDTNFKLFISTNDGVLEVLPSEYIVKGNSGKLYVSSKSDFESRYELA